MLRHGLQRIPVLQNFSAFIEAENVVANRVLISMLGRACCNVRLLKIDQVVQIACFELPYVVKASTIVYS